MQPRSQFTNLSGAPQGSGGDTVHSPGKLSHGPLRVARGLFVALAVGALLFAFGERTLNIQHSTLNSQLRKGAAAPVIDFTLPVEAMSRTYGRLGEVALPAGGKTL